MTEKIKKLLKNLKNGEVKKYRKPLDREKINPRLQTAEEYVSAFRENLDMQYPIITEDDDFGFNIAVDSIIPGVQGNVIPNYGKLVTGGFCTVEKEIESSRKNTADVEKIKYADAMCECIHLCLDMSDKYRKKAKECGNERLYNALCKVPYKGAESFYEACVFMKLINYFLHLGFTIHLPFGRFDQYMYPFYLADKEKGIKDEEILETLEAFFISINRDTDLYQGIQKGDNGQSMVLGGFDADGQNMFNELSKLCMDASLELNLIDPKINLRVGKNTPDEIYEFATLLTKQGLGFPQYCNDDIIVPGLIKLGYSPEDAQNYGVAACWENIVSSCGADVPNISVMDFPNVVNGAVTKSLMEADSFEELMETVKKAVRKRCDEIVDKEKNTRQYPMPLMSLFLDGCTKNLTDAFFGGTKYGNYGCHGAGIANAADMLAAIKLHIYDKKDIKKSDLITALQKDFESSTPLRNALLASPKMGSNDDYVDDIANTLLDEFAKNINNRPNGKGGIWRAGTGSAQNYIECAVYCPTTADGRKNGEPYSSSFSPSLYANPSGILSVLQSFTKYDLTNVVNGGPMTIEIHDTVFKNDEGIKKVAQLVKGFVLLGGHQLQLNSINREILLNAQKHPENYKNLIVRVWGWSGYFNELDIKYQRHIIKRTEFLQ